MFNLFKKQFKYFISFHYSRTNSENQRETGFGNIEVLLNEFSAREVEIAIENSMKNFTDVKVVILSYSKE